MQDGLEIVKGGVDMPGAENYNSEELYEILVKQANKNQSGQNSNSNEQGDVGHDTHTLWGEAIKEQKNENQDKQEQQQENGQSKNGGQSKEDEKESDKQDLQNGGNKQDKKDEDQKEKNQKSSFAKQGEKETFEQNKKERKKNLKELSKELLNKSTSGAGDEVQREGRKVSDIGIALPLIDWRRLLRQAVKYNED